MEHDQIMVVSCMGKTAMVNTPEAAKLLLKDYGKWAMAWTVKDEQVCMVGFCDKHEQVVWDN